MQLVSDSALLWLGLVLLVITLVIGRGICKIRLGRALVALREDELAARCVGIRPLRYKIAADLIGGALAGVRRGYAYSPPPPACSATWGRHHSMSRRSFPDLVKKAACILGSKVLGSMLGSVLGAAIPGGHRDAALFSYVPQISGHQDLAAVCLLKAGHHLPAARRRDLGGRARRLVRKRS